MIEVEYKNDAFYVKGTLNLGYIGVFKNTHWLKDSAIAEDKTKSDEEVAVFGEGHIVIIDTLKDIEQSLAQDTHWSVLKEYSPLNSPEEIAHALALYYNSFEEKIKVNMGQFNDNFLYYALEFFGIANENFRNFRQRLGMYFVDTPNDGSVEKPEFEKYVNYGFSDKKEEGQRIMLENILSHIKADILTLAGADMAFQCSDTILPDSLYLKKAYAEIDWDLTFNNWQN